MGGAAEHLTLFRSVYGEAEVIVGDEDTQPLETPIVAPVSALLLFIFFVLICCSWSACVCVLCLVGEAQAI